jgi:GTPase SAR1 family protein
MKKPSILHIPQQSGPDVLTQLNVLVLGCAGVGKTLLIRHLKRESFDDCDCEVKFPLKVPFPRSEKYGEDSPKKDRSSTPGDGTSSHLVKPDTTPTVRAHFR